MLQGRADQARELVAELTKANNSSVVVARPRDRTIAYYDQTTREYVENRLKDKSVIRWVEKVFPGFSPKIEQLKQFGLPSIRGSKRLEKDAKAPKVDVDADLWAQSIKTLKPVTYYDQNEAGQRDLVVLLPIRNDAKCKICHGTEHTSVVPERERIAYFGSAVVPPRFLSEVRAMLVVRRSQHDLDQTIRANNRTIVIVGFRTIAMFGVLILVLVQFMGVNFVTRRFAN